jgi:hypothetical protein
VTQFEKEQEKSIADILFGRMKRFLALPEMSYSMDLE